ncbi:MAG TPA: acyl-CoA thioesterase domain-containing protein [Caldimonas sp.]
MAGKLPAWDGRDLGELLRLEPTGPRRFRNRLGDANEHGRAYGGQLLAGAAMAAAAAVPEGRALTTLQTLFLQGALHDRPIDFEVTVLQDGRRFSSRHVRGSQGGDRLVLDAQVTFAVPMSAPDHMAPPEPLSMLAEDPDTMPRLSDLPPAWGEGLRRAVGYTFDVKEALDFRLPAAPPSMHLELPEPRCRFWLKARHELPEDAHLHAAAFAYLSDWWLNFPSVGGHLPQLAAGESLYVASLNHAIWLHRPLRADEWLHFDCISPSAVAGRSLSVARVHDRAGRLVASATQESLLAPAHG